MPDHSALRPTQPNHAPSRLGKPFYASPWSSFRRAFRPLLLRPVNHAEHPERAALLRAIVSDADLLAAVLQEPVDEIDRQNLLVHSKREACAPLVDTRAVTHDAPLRRRNRDRSRVHLEGLQ